MKFRLSFLFSWLFMLSVSITFGQIAINKSIDFSKLEVNNVFQNVVKNEHPPKILDTLETNEIANGIIVTKIHFQSFVDENRTNTNFAYIIRPKNKTKLPAMLILHGGTQSADDYLQLGIAYAKRGYACLIPDLPGITSPENSYRKGNGSSGKWAENPYGAKHFEVNPEVSNCVIYEGVVAAIQAFYLLKSQSFVKPKAIGIRGLSWGGYASVLTTALLEKQVKAGLAVYGSGFYDLPSYFKPILDGIDSVSRNKWLSSIDAGRYADRITAPFFFMAASNDTYFHPPAVMATFDRIKGTKNILFAPNNDHGLSNLASPDSTEFAFFDFHLRHKGPGIPEIAILSEKLQKDGSLQIEFDFEKPIQEAILWYSASENDWMKKPWKSIDATIIQGNRYRVNLPKVVLEDTGYWYLMATDKDKVSNGTKIYKTNR